MNPDKEPATIIRREALRFIDSLILRHQRDGGDMDRLFNYLDTTEGVRKSSRETARAVIFDEAMNFASFNRRDPASVFCCLIRAKAVLLIRYAESFRKRAEHHTHAKVKA